MAPRGKRCRTSPALRLKLLPKSQIGARQLRSCRSEARRSEHPDAMRSGRGRAAVLCAVAAASAGLVGLALSTTVWSSLPRAPGTPCVNSALALALTYSALALILAGGFAGGAAGLRVRRHARGLWAGVWRGATEHQVSPDAGAAHRATPDDDGRVGHVQQRNLLRAGCRKH